MLHDAVVDRIGMILFCILFWTAIGIGAYFVFR